MTKTWEGYIFYYSPYCPFCVRVTNVIDQLGIKMEMRDTISSSEYREELIKGGGRSTVPCLLHPDGTWQYESMDIIAFLEKKSA